MLPYKIVMNIVLMGEIGLLFVFIQCSKHP
jgi:hypothetical protein